MRLVCGARYSLSSLSRATSFQRFAGFPTSISCLSRLFSASKQNEELSTTKPSGAESNLTAKQQFSAESKLSAAAESQLSAAESKLSAAKQELSAAESKLSAAESKLSAAESKLSAAKQEGDAACVSWAKEGVSSAQAGVSSAQSLVGACTKVVVDLMDAPFESAAGPSSTFLGLDDFVHPKDLPATCPENTPTYFVSPGWLEWQVKLVKKWLPQSDGKSFGARVPPLALISCSAGGKTRALEELAKNLQQTELHLANGDSKKPFVISITFNHNTGYASMESSDPMDSILSRLAYAIAKKEALLGSDGDVRSLHRKGKLQFKTDEESILQWLQTHPCILFVDELNGLIRNGPDVDTKAMERICRFLKDNFLARANRYLIFTSHGNITSDQLVDYMTPSIKGSDRRVQVSSLPCFTTKEEVGKVLEERHVKHPAYYGNLPGLSFSALSSEDMARVRVGRFLGHYPEAQPFFAHIIADLFTGDHQSLSEFYPFVRSSKDKQRVWIPAFLEHLLDSSLSTEIDQKFRTSSRRLLQLLGTQKLQSGGAWEWVVVCAFFFRVLNHRLNGIDIPRDNYATLQPLLPQLPYSYDIDVTFPERSSHDLVKHLFKPRTSSTPCVVIAYPKHAGFDTYDILVAVYAGPGAQPQLHGYQLKSRKLPDSKPFTGVTSFVLRSQDVNPSSPVQHGWNVVDVRSRTNFLGPSFSPLIRMEN